MEAPIARSYLYVPASRPDRFDKALASGADAVIVDLEDAVPADEKVAARNALAQWLMPAKPVIVRVNAASSQWFRDDLEVCRNDGVAGIILPKAEALDEELIDICTRGGNTAASADRNGNRSRAGSDHCLRPLRTAIAVRHDRLSTRARHRRRR
jgi:citrate lyase beta subunit